MRFFDFFSCVIALAVYIIPTLVMKKLSLTLIVAALTAFSANANAGWFGASFSKTPSVTLFGQTLTVPVPSLTLGADAGTSVSASASSNKGISASIPFVKLGVKSPTLTVGAKDKKVNVSAAGVKKAKK
jgi:hypothetical protein